MDDEDDDYYGRCHDDECGEDKFEDAEEDDRGPGWFEHQWGGPDDEDEYSEGGNEHEGDFDDDGEYCEEDDEHKDEGIEMTRQFRGETGFAATVRGRIIAEASTLEWLIKGLRSEHPDDALETIVVWHSYVPVALILDGGRVLTVEWSDGITGGEVTYRETTLEELVPSKVSQPETCWMCDKPIAECECPM